MATAKKITRRQDKKRTASGTPKSPNDQAAPSGTAAPVEPPHPVTTTDRLPLADAAAAPPIAGGFSCDTTHLFAPPDAASTPLPSSDEVVDGGRIHRRTTTGFTGVHADAYKATPAAPATNGDATPAWARVDRHELIGKPGPDPCAFHVRHFEVAPGGYSSFETHTHVHAVIVERGHGRVRIRDGWHDVYPGDVIYVDASTPHQLVCPGGASQPFGFFCVVDAKRDRPVELRDA